MKNKGLGNKGNADATVSGTPTLEEEGSGKTKARRLDGGESQNIEIEMGGWVRVEWMGKTGLEHAGDAEDSKDRRVACRPAAVGAT